jgi:hypothetical protein
LDDFSCRLGWKSFIGPFSQMKNSTKNYGNSNISPCKNIIFKKSSKRNQNPSTYYNSIITNLKFQHKPKLSSFKNRHIKIDLLLLPRGQNPLRLLYSIISMKMNFHRRWFR